MRKQYFIFGATVIYFLLNLLVIVRHEPWRDELQSWMIGRDSSNAVEVIYNSRYEGHPRLWYEILFLLSRLSRSFLIMQLFHLTVATLSAYLILKYMPFAGWAKLMLIFSYFLTYEFSIISRNYALGVLGLFLICAFYNQNKLWAKLLGIFLLCQSSVFGVIMALAYLWLSLFNLGKTIIQKKTMGLIGQLFIIFFIIINSVLAIWQMQPPSDSGYVVGWITIYNLTHLQAVLGIFWKVLIPIPQPIFHFWNSNVLDNQPLLMAELGVGLFFLSCLIFQSRKIRVMYLLGILGLLGFYYTKNIGYLRHQGHIFIWMFACLWLDRILITFVAGWRKILTNVFIVGILGSQLYTSYYAIKSDWQYPFSGSQEAVGFIKQNISPEYPLVVDSDYTVSPVAAYLNRPLYYAVNQKWGTYLLWDQSRLFVDYERTMQEAEKLHDIYHQPVVMILNYQAGTSANMRLLYQIKQSIVTDEIYNIYLWQ